MLNETQNKLLGETIASSVLSIIAADLGGVLRDPMFSDEKIVMKDYEEKILLQGVSADNVQLLASLRKVYLGEAEVFKTRILDPETGRYHELVDHVKKGKLPLNLEAYGDPKTPATQADVRVVFYAWVELVTQVYKINAEVIHQMGAAAAAPTIEQLKIKFEQQHFDLIKQQQDCQTALPAVTEEYYKLLNDRKVLDKVLAVVLQRNADLKLAQAALQHAATQGPAKKDFAPAKFVVDRNKDIKTAPVSSGAQSLPPLLPHSPLLDEATRKKQKHLQIMARHAIEEPQKQWLRTQTEESLKVAGATEAQLKTLPTVYELSSFRIESVETTPDGKAVEAGVEAQRLPAATVYGESYVLNSDLVPMKNGQSLDKNIKEILDEFGKNNNHLGVFFNGGDPSTPILFHHENSSSVLEDAHHEKNSVAADFTARFQTPYQAEILYLCFILVKVDNPVNGGPPLYAFYKDPKNSGDREYSFIYRQDYQDLPFQKRLIATPLADEIIVAMEESTNQKDKVVAAAVKHNIEHGKYTACVVPLHRRDLTPAEEQQKLEEALRKKQELIAGRPSRAKAKLKAELARLDEIIAKKKLENDAKKAALAAKQAEYAAKQAAGVAQPELAACKTQLDAYQNAYQKQVDDCKIFGPLPSERTITMTMVPDWNQEAIRSPLRPAVLSVVLGPANTTLETAPCRFDINLFAMDQHRGSFKKPEDEAIDQGLRALLWYDGKPFPRYHHAVDPDGCYLPNTQQCKELGIVSICMRPFSEEKDPHALLYVRRRYGVTYSQGAGYLKVVQGHHYYLNITFATGSRFAELVGTGGWSPRMFLNTRGPGDIPEYDPANPSKGYLIFANFVINWAQGVELPLEAHEQQLSLQAEEQDLTDEDNAKTAAAPPASNTSQPGADGNSMRAGGLTGAVPQPVGAPHAAQSPTASASSSIVKSKETPTAMQGVTATSAGLPAIAALPSSESKPASMYNHTAIKAELVPCYSRSVPGIYTIGKCFSADIHTAVRTAETKTDMILTQCREVAQSRSLARKAQVEANENQKIDEKMRLTANGVELLTMTQAKFFWSSEYAPIKYPHIKAVNKVIATIKEEEWRCGVFITFSPNIHMDFIEKFALALHGKAGGVKVLVKPVNKRLLAVQLGQDKSKLPPVYLTIDPDGNFTRRIAIPAAPTIQPPQPVASRPTP